MAEKLKSPFGPAKLGVLGSWAGRGREPSFRGRKKSALMKHAWLSKVLSVPPWNLEDSDQPGPEAVSIDAIISS